VGNMCHGADGSLVGTNTSIIYLHRLVPGILSQTSSLLDSANGTCSRHAREGLSVEIPPEADADMLGHLHGDYHPPVTIMFDDSPLTYRVRNGSGAGHKTTTWGLSGSLNVKIV